MPRYADGDVRVAIKQLDSTLPTPENGISCLVQTRAQHVQGGQFLAKGPFQTTLATICLFGVSVKAPQTHTSGSTGSSGARK